MTAAEDRENRRAVAALVRRLRDRDAALEAGADDVPDYEVLAAEFMTALHGQGWRFIPAVAPYRQRATDAATADPESRGDIAAFRAKAAAHAEQVRAQKAGKAPSAVTTHPSDTNHERTP